MTTDQIYFFFKHIFGRMGSG